MNPPLLSSWISQGLGFDIDCGCGHHVYVPAADANRLLGGQRTIEEAEARLRCSTCDASGKSGRITLRFSIRDYYDRMRAAGMKVA